MPVTTKVAWIHRVSVCLAFAGMLWLASCQSGPEIKPSNAWAADSTLPMLSADPPIDPPVKPSGPGGGPP